MHDLEAAITGQEFYVCLPHFLPGPTIFEVPFLTIL